MENDESAVCFDHIVCQSGQFGFFQKRLFLINTLIQSACISVLLYTCAVMPEVDETDNDACAGTSPFLTNNGFHEDSYHDRNNKTDSNETSAVLTGLLVAFNATFEILSQNVTAALPLATSNVSFSQLWTSNSSSVSSTTSFFENASTESQTQSALQEESNASVGYVMDAVQENMTALGNGIQNLAGLSGNILDLVNSSSSSLKLLGDFVHENATLIYPEVGISTESSLNFSWINTSVYPTFVTSHDNSSQACVRAFILLREDLTRSQILDSLNAEELALVTFYGQGAAMILGAAIGSMTADIYGRRKLLYISLTCMLVFHCLVALSITWIMFIFLRMVAVGCAGATIVVSFVIVVEFLGPDWRDACTCSCFWAFGAIVLSLETFATLHWRWLAILSGGVCLPLIGTYFTSMESLRWMQCHHRFTKAEGGFREVVSVNSATVPDIMVLLDRSRGCIANNMHQKKFTFIDLLHSLDSTKWTVALVYTCIISSCVYFCLLWRVRQITGLLYVDVFLPYVIDLPLTWSVIIMNRCLGRRWCLFLYAVASGFALISVLILHITGNVAYMPSLVTGLSLFGKIGVSASLALTFLVSIEMYPTVTRCMGVAVAIASISGGCMLSNALAFLEQYHYTVPFVVYGAMMSSVGAVGLMFPETINKPLKNVQQCRHRKIPLMEGARLVGRPPNLWDAC